MQTTGYCSLYKPAANMQIGLLASKLTQDADQDLCQIEIYSPQTTLTRWIFCSHLLKDGNNYYQDDGIYISGWGAFERIKAREDKQEN